MNILININEIPVLDSDFDDLESLYSDPEADCVGDFGDENIPLATPEQERIYRLWEEYDERQADKFNRRRV